MPTSAREAILDGMVTALRVIGTTGSYSATVRPTVTRTRHPTVDVPQLPFIYVGAENEEYDRTGFIGAAGTYDRILHVRVQYLFASPDMDQDASRAIHDVEYALRDWTIAGVTNDLEIVSNEVAATTDDSPVVNVSFLVDVKYRTNDNAPATRV